MSNKEARDRLAQKLCHVSSKSLFRLERIDAGKVSSKNESGGHKRKVHSILEDGRNHFVPLTVKSHDGGSITFYAADIPKVLSSYAASIPWWKARLQGVQKRQLHLVLFADACTGGNVLAVASSKDILFFYMAIVDLGELQRPDAWMAVSAIPHRDIVQCAGPGYSSIIRSLLTWLKDHVLSKPFLIGAETYRATLVAMLGDYDGFRQVFAAKGASGLKPCLLCANVLSRDREEAKLSKAFFTICDHEVAKFQKIRPADFFTVYDRMLRERESWNKTTLQEEEKYFGYIIHPESLFASAELREYLNQDHVFLDAAHCYYANGIASQELILFMEFLKATCNIEVENLRDSVRATKWNCSDSHYNSPSGRAFLFHPSFFKGKCYGGSAGQTWFLLPLLWWYGSHVVDDKECAVWKSFSALMQCHITLRQVRSGRTEPEVLDMLQQQHQKNFEEAYPSQSRPKHHLRLHLPHQYKHFGFYCDTFPTEAKHRMYKAMIADTHQSLWQERTGKLSRHILGRMHLMTENNLSESEWRSGLAPPIYPAEEVRDVLPDCDCAISKKYRWHSKELRSNMPVLLRNQGGLICFFVNDANTDYCIYQTMTEMDSNIPGTTRFRPTGKREAMPCSTFHQCAFPLWWYDDGSEIICLE